MPKFCIFYKLRNFSKKNTKTNISEKGMKINFKNTANIPSFYNKVDRKDFSIVSSNFYIFVSCYYKYPSHWIFPLLFTNFHIPCISSILFSLYIIFFFHGIFSIFIFQNLLYIYIHIFSLPDIKFFLSILSLFAGTLIFLIEPETFWFSYLVIHHRGYFYRKDKIHFHSFFDSIQIFPTFKLAPLSDITDEWRKGKKGRGMKRGMSEKKEKWRCRPGPANGLISKAPQRGILGPGRWWNSRSTGVSEDIFAWTGWLGENLRELLCCYEFLWLWMRQGHRNGISQLSILNLHRFKSSVVSAGGSFLQRFLFPFLI